MYLVMACVKDDGPRAPSNVRTPGNRESAARNRLLVLEYQN